MKTEYHITMTQTVLSDRVSEEALRTIVEANISQDDWQGQIGHPEFHFDDSAFTEGNDYIDTQRQIARSALLAGNPKTAREAFGRLLHSAQDLYAHSNYVHLWVLRVLSEEYPALDDADSLYAQLKKRQITTEFMREVLREHPDFDISRVEDQIEPLDDEILNHPALFSGRIYIPWDYLTFIQGFKPFVKKIIPDDSHAKMNLDAPESGSLFKAGIAAAKKRTLYEYDTFVSSLSPEAAAIFTGMD